MFAPLTVVCVRPIERGGRVHLPGERVTVPQPEGAAMIAAGFAQPEGVPVEDDPRRVVGRFVSRRQP